MRRLLERKLPVRAFVHSADALADELKALGAEIVVGDLRDSVAFRSAMRGVRRAYFTHSISEGLLEAATVFAVAATEGGVEAIGERSQISARSDYASPAARRH